jgi:hypothetical protein
LIAAAGARHDWQYEPAPLDGRPVLVVMTVNFALR